MQISRSEQKRRMKDVENLVTELVTLPAPVLDRSPCPEEIRLLLKEAAKLEGSPRQRHIKYITKQVQGESLVELYDLVGKYRGKALAERQQLHTLEFYRDALINEAMEQRQLCRESNTDWTEDWTGETLVELKQLMPEIDVLVLSRLAYLFVQTRNPRYTREIFRSLRATQELRERNSARQAKA